MGGKGVRRRAVTGGAPLNDERLSKRLVNVAAVKAYYRLIDMPEDSAVTMDNILQPHRDRTLPRMLTQQTVLCVKDGSDLNYNGLAACTGLGQIGANQTGAKSRGLHLHTTLAISPSGLPLGVLNAQWLAPEPKTPEDKRRAFVIPIEEKKTFVWIEHHRDMVAVAAQMPHTRLIVELPAAAARPPNHWHARHYHPRLRAGGGSFLANKAGSFFESAEVCAGDGWITGTLVV